MNGAGSRYVLATTLLAGIVMLVGGVWSLTAPRSFAEFANFPYHEHFEHDLGALQLGIATMLLLALMWSDALATALAGFLVGNTVHAVNHAVDLDRTGRTVHFALTPAVESAAHRPARQRAAEPSRPG